MFLQSFSLWMLLVACLKTFPLEMGGGGGDHTGKSRYAMEGGGKH